MQIDADLLAGAEEREEDTEAKEREKEREEEREKEQEKEREKEREKEQRSSAGNSQALKSGIFASSTHSVAVSTKKHEKISDSTVNSINKNQTVQLEFLIGDVDETPIAQAEAHAEQQILLEEAAEEEMARRRERGGDEDDEEED